MEKLFCVVMFDSYDNEEIVMDSGLSEERAFQIAKAARELNGKANPTISFYVEEQSWK
jgi:hypothetical protein